MGRDFLLVIIAVLLALDLLAPLSGCGPHAAARKIEYKVAEPGPAMGPREIEELLNQLGREGWVLVHALPGLGLILRR
jgi:hypothetical protein